MPVGIDRQQLRSEGTLKIYLPDGHLADGGIKDIWKYTSLPYPEMNSGYVVIDDAELHGKYHYPMNHVDRVALILRRPQNIPESVKYDRGIGISGEDFIIDRLGLPITENVSTILGEDDMVDLLDMQCRPANILAAFPEEIAVRDPDDARSFIYESATFRPNYKAVVATEFPHMTKCAMIDIFGVESNSFDIKTTDGKTEQYTLTDADWIVDVVETGNSLRRTSLRAAKPHILMPTVPHLIARSDIVGEHEPVVQELYDRLERGIKEVKKRNPEKFKNKLDPTIFA